MAKRITIMLDEDLDEKIRARQIRVMTETQKGYSYSQSLNDMLRRKK